jgi:acetyltransferase-like isoleucine patch superfamily enzyme
MITHVKENFETQYTQYNLNKPQFTYGIENIKVYFGNMSDVKIGNFCSIADNCKIYIAAHSYHNYNNVTTYPFGARHTNVFPFRTKDTQIHNYKGVTIGNDVWIGANCTIMDGVNIGDGAVLANNSHVVKHVEIYVERLQKIKWWDFDVETINANLTLLCDTNIDTFRDKFDKQQWL